MPISCLTSNLPSIVVCINAVLLLVVQNDCSARGTRYCWAWGQHSFETNKWTIFLKTEASFPYWNWSTKMAGFIWLGSTSVQHVNTGWRLSRLPFLSLCKNRKFLETKTYFFIASKRKLSAKKKLNKYLVHIWFA